MEMSSAKRRSRFSLSLTADMVYEVTYRAFTPDVATVTLLHLGTPLVKYVYGLSDAFGIVVSMVTRNDAAALRSAPSVINVPPRNAGTCVCVCLCMCGVRVHATQAHK